MFSLITAQSHKWGCGGTADTPVLGTGFFGSEGSNPFAPTRCNDWLNCCPSSKSHGNRGCTGSCTCCISSVIENKNGRDCRYLVKAQVLGNSAPLPIYSLTHIIQQYQPVLFNIIYIQYCISLATPCN